MKVFIATPTIASTMQPATGSMQACEHASTKMAATMEATTMEQLPLVRAIKAVGTRVRQVSTVVGPTTLPTDSARAASNRAVASIARVMVSPSLPTMQADATGRADDGQG